MVSINYSNLCCILLLPAFFHLFICSTIVQSVIVNTNRPSHSNGKSKQSGNGNRNTGANGAGQYGSHTRPNSEFHSENYSTEQTNEERRLFNYLMRNYDNTIRPVSHAAKPINIRLGITLTQIFDLDEKNQVLTTNVWLDQEWVDDFLTWNSTDFGNITKIRIPCQSIWLPDIVLYNNADDYTRGYMNSRAVITPDGNVFWPPPTKFRSTCPVDVTYFPFDDQTCKMKFGSWIYDGLQVNIDNRTEAVDLDNYVANGEWDLIHTSLVRNVVFYPCCSEPFPDVTITVTIRRKVLYYMYNVILPCIMMSALTLLVFCLPPESGEKIALGVTVLLAFSVFMLAISEKLPETSESIPLLGVYLTVVMAITSISIIMTVVVLNFHYCSPVNKRELPDWLRKLIKSKSILDEFYCAKYEYSNKIGDRIGKDLNGSGTTTTTTTTTTMLQRKMKALMLEEEVKLRHTTQTQGDPAEMLSPTNQTNFTPQHGNNTSSYNNSSNLDSNYKLWNNIAGNHHNNCNSGNNKIDPLFPSSNVRLNQDNHQIRHRSSMPNHANHSNACPHNQYQPSQQQPQHQFESELRGRQQSIETPNVSAHHRHSHPRAQNQPHHYQRQQHQTRGPSNLLSKYNKIYTISGEQCNLNNSTYSRQQEQSQPTLPKCQCSFGPESSRQDLMQPASTKLAQSDAHTDTSVLKGKCDFSSLSTSSATAATRIIDDLCCKQQQSIADTLYNNIIASNSNKNCNDHRSVDGNTRSMITSIAPYFACAASQIIDNNRQNNTARNLSSLSNWPEMMNDAPIFGQANGDCSCENALNNPVKHNQNDIFMESSMLDGNDTADSRYSIGGQYPKDDLSDPGRNTSTTPTTPAKINRSAINRDSVNKLSDHHNNCALNKDNFQESSPADGLTKASPTKHETFHAPNYEHHNQEPRESNTSSEQNEEVLQMLRYLMYRQNVEDNYGRRINEWKLLSMFIDKILFWIFMVVTVVTSLVFLVIIPIQRRGF